MTTALLPTRAPCTCTAGRARCPACVAFASSVGTEAQATLSATIAARRLTIARLRSSVRKLRLRLQAQQTLLASAQALLRSEVQDWRQQQRLHQHGRQT